MWRRPPPRSVIKRLSLPIYDIVNIDHINAGGRQLVTRFEKGTGVTLDRDLERDQKLLPMRTAVR